MTKGSPGAMEPRGTPNQPVGAAQMRGHLSWDPIEDEFDRWTTKGGGN